MEKNRIRPLAICVFHHQGRILVAEGYDPLKKEPFCRPLGGGMEFGEHSEQTIRRRLIEGIGVEVVGSIYLGTLENIFVFNRKPGHETVQVYDGVLEDSRLYEQTEFKGKEADIDEPVREVWKSMNEFCDGKSILYPAGLLELLQK